MTCSSVQRKEGETMTVTIHVDMDVRCPWCGAKGARIVDGEAQPCLACVLRKIEGKPIRRRKP